MSVRTARLAARVVACLAGATPATADFTGLVVEAYVGEGWLENGYAGLTTFRVYAQFDGRDDGKDGVHACGAIFGHATWVSTDDLFHNDPLGGLTAPIDLTSIGVWSNQWDTYVTIGATDADGDATITSPQVGTDTDDLSRTWWSDAAAWFISIMDEQGLAVDGRVLVAQMTVAAGEQVRGVMDVGLFDHSAMREQEFNSIAVCCRSDGQCVPFEPGACDDGVIAPSCALCPEPCCLPSGICFDHAPSGCTAIGGTPVADCGSCGEATGACCLGGGECTTTTSVDCEAQAGVYRGDGRSCDDPFGDVSGDGSVDFADIIVILTEWQTAGPAGDANCDGTVDFADIIDVLSTWGD